MTYLYKGLAKTQQTNKTHDSCVQGIPCGENISRIGDVAADARSVRMPPKSDAELEAEALAWCERMEGKLSKKKSNYKPKRRGRYANSNR